MTIGFLGPEPEPQSGPNWTHIILHHTATSQAVTVEQIRADHLRRGWLDIGYHFLVDDKGRVHPGRPLKMQGAHAPGYNTKGIGVTAIGDFDAGEMPEAQRLALVEHVRELMVNCGISPANVLYHGDVNATRCPGRYFPDIKNALDTPFKDVPANHWARDAVSQVKSMGILGGYPDGTFRGDQPPTRYELAVVIAKLLNKECDCKCQQNS